MARKFRTKEWAVLMYIAHDNDLAPFTQAKTGEIKSVGSTAAADVITQVDTPDQPLILRKRESKGRSYPLPNPEKNPNFGDKRTLKRFIELTLTDFQPRRSMLVISTHGTGFTIITDDSARRERSSPGHADHNGHGAEDHDNDPRTRAEVTLDNVELKEALMAAVEQRGPFDLIVFDACLMNTIEVAYQIREAGRFMVGSQSNIPVPGCRFSPTFEIMRDETISTADVARALVDNGMITQLIQDECSAMAALDLGQADALAKAISELAKALIKALGNRKALDAITLAHLGALAFIDSETVDLFDFCRRLVGAVDDQDVRAAATGVMFAVGSFVIRSNPRGSVVEGARGISITLPRSNILPPDYDKLDFAEETQWIAFLKAYLGKAFGERAGEIEPEPEPEHEPEHQHQHEPALAAAG